MEGGMHKLFSKPLNLRSPRVENPSQDLTLPSSGSRRMALASAGLAGEGPLRVLGPWCEVTA